MLTDDYEWFSSWFTEDYLSVYPHRDDKEATQQIQKLLEIIPDFFGPVLDLGCGPGRHTNALLNFGFYSVGVDLSPDLLKHATKCYPSIGNNLVRADMRELPFASSTFATVASFFTSFGYFSSDEQHCDVLKECQRILIPGGRILLDLPNRERVINAKLDNTKRVVDGMSILEERTLTADKSRVEKKITISCASGASTFDTKSFRESVRIFSTAELESMLKASGFVSTSFHADFASTPSSCAKDWEDADRILVVAKTMS